MPSTARVNLFTQHSRAWRNNRYVYPVVSRRSKGLSIGVNLNPDKACNFDCVYCSVDRTVPSTVREIDPQVLHVELAHMIELARSGGIWREPPFDQTPDHLRRINDVAFSGDGEPTSYPHFHDACELAASLLQQAGLHDAVKIVLITNATLFHHPHVARALEFLDAHNGEIWAKLDAGTQAYYQLVERTKIPLRRVLDNLLLAGRARPIVIQSLFMKVHGRAPPPVGDRRVRPVPRRAARRGLPNETCPGLHDRARHRRVVRRAARERGAGRDRREGQIAGTHRGSLLRAFVTDRSPLTLLALRQRAVVGHDRAEVAVGLLLSDPPQERPQLRRRAQ